MVNHEPEIHMLCDVTTDVDTTQKWPVYIFNKQICIHRQAKFACP